MNALAGASGGSGGVGEAGVVASGVRIAAVVEDPSPPLKRYQPGHPDAGPDGYVAYPNMNPLTEMVDLMGATRAYGLNGSAVQAEKSMIASALEIARS
jgi:flagellar basal-body rod protein FlgC